MDADLDGVYDDDTLALVEQWRPRSEPAPAEVSRWRQRTVAGAIVTALALGVREALEPEERDEIVEEIDLTGLFDPAQPVRYIHVPGAPNASVAAVRP